METIFALSSGAPPAGIAVVRISGPAASETLAALAGRLPEPRRARLASLHDEHGVLLDQGLMLWFPGPQTATGEDLAELHLHGGRAVVAAVEGALARKPGLRRAEAGEFTRRAFANGRIDLAEAEGLADLLEAETELQRAAALMTAGGALSRRVEAWRERLLALSAQVEAALDFAEENGAGELSAAFGDALGALAADIGEAMNAPSAETLRAGFRVALAGPPNAGKSTLFNSLLESEAAIATPLPGTTRDVLERPVAFEGVPFTLVDMAGLRDGCSDPIEHIGIARAEAEIARADLVLWLGPEGAGPPHAWEIEPQVDRSGRAPKKNARHRVSAVTREGLDELRRDLITHAREVMPRPGQMAINRRQRDLLGDAADALRIANLADNPLIVAENMRIARLAFDRLLGRTGIEDVLNSLFERFCIGK
jgi:tRNA modification GTPase